jgi:uncharacterized membrane protein YdfJ with MMPL/SSD domain
MRPNLAARAGRWSAAHWKTATFGWLAFVVIAVMVGNAVGTVKLTDVENTSGENARAQRMLDDAHIRGSATEHVLIASRRVGARSPAFRAAVGDVRAALARRPEVKSLQPTTISAGNHAALVAFDMRGDPETAPDRVQPLIDAVARVQRAHPNVRIAEIGDASAPHALNKQISSDFQRAERLSVPLTFLIMLFAFGAFVAAGLPVLLALSAVIGSIGLSAIASHLAHASDSISSIILLMGMAVGVDYCLFYVQRARAERAAGHSEADSVARAAATSGHAVLISGATVLIAMAGMLLAGSKTFTSLGVGAMIVVAVAMVGSLTVLPALLGKLGDRVDRGLVSVLAAGTMGVIRHRPKFLVRLRDRRTLLQRAKGTRGESRVWAAVLRRTLRRPKLAAVTAVSLLVVLALPALGMHLRLPEFSDLPKQLGIVKTYDAVNRAFPGTPSPAIVVVHAPDVTTPAVQHALADLRHEALASGAMHAPIRTQVMADHTVAEVDIPLSGAGDDQTSFAALKTLRHKVVPNALGGLADVQYAVTGDTAGNADFTSTMRASAPYVFAFVLGLAFLLLLFTFRSIVIPLQAIALNLLSVGAAYGVLVWLFQDGHGQSLLGFHSNGAIVTWLPLFLFTVLFGLSMDYHVFIVSRIRELHDRGMATSEAVERGIRSTASTVTSAALVMVAVFGIFATLSTLDIKQMGVGLAVAVILDATIIRGVLLPATMKLMGEWNWYLPRWMARMPRLSVRSASQRALAEVD